jgi:hypothetical protein
VELSFRPLTLEALDEAKAEALCLFVREEERPLSGLAGLVDWRLAGRLSGMIRTGLVTGASGEALLTPPGARLPFEKLFLFGIGSLRDPAELSARVVEALRRLSQAGVRDAALQLPAGIPPDEGARRLVEEEQAPARGLLFAADPAQIAETLAQTAAARPPDRRVVKVPAPEPKPGTPAAPPREPALRTGPQRYIPPPSSKAPKKRR